MKTNQAAAAQPRPGYGPGPTRQASRRQGPISSARAGILDVLIDQPEPCTVKALSALTRHHPNTIREHLDGLVNDRLAVRTRASAQRRGRPAWLYSVAPDVGAEPGVRQYAGLASTLAAQIARTSRQPSADSSAAGRLWGQQLVRQSPTTAAVAAADEDVNEGVVVGASVPVGSSMAMGVDVASGPQRVLSAMTARREVVALLDRIGFAPSPDARFDVVKLRRCPLLEAAHQFPEVVCGVHLGVVRGALEELGADPDRTERTSLQPFPEPGACRLSLLPNGETAR